jgi:F-type H+-transporting ATPase subunit b
LSHLIPISLMLLQGGGETPLINLPLLVSSLLGFLILFFVLKATLFKPVLSVIDERRDSIEQAFREVDQARADVARMKSEYEAEMATIAATSQAKLQEAVETGQRLAAEIRTSAEDQREKLLRKTQEDIGREKDKALAELREQAVGLSFEIAQRVLREGLDQAQHDRLVSRFVDDLKRLN